MADVKISQLPAVVTITPSTDVAPLVSGGVTSQATAQQIVNAGLASPSAIGGTTPNTATFTTVDANVIQATNATTGLQFNTSSGTLVAAIGTNRGALFNSAVTIGGNVALQSGSLSLQGSISVPAWGTTGVRYANLPATLTDTTSSGTVAAAYTNAFNGNTIAASNPVTFTVYTGSYFKQPIAGTNVTFGTSYALGADSIFSASNITGTTVNASTGNYTNLNASGSLITNYAQVSLKGLTSGNSLLMSGAGATNNPELILTFNDAASTANLNITSVGGTSTATVLTIQGNGTGLWNFDVLGNIFPNGTTPSTTMTSGFLSLPAAAGVPTGTPAVANAKNVPLYYDTSNDQLFAYNNVNAAWNGVALGPQIGLFRASAASIPNSTDTVVLLQNQDALIGKNISYNSGTGAFTNTGGSTIYVQVSYTVAWDNASSTGNRSQWIAVNGDVSTSRYGMQDITSTGADYDVFSGSTVIPLNSGDYFQLYCWQNSGGSLTQGGAFGGMATGYSTRLQFSVL
jgi:hypothetical protein